MTIKRNLRVKELPSQGNAEAFDVFNDKTGRGFAVTKIEGEGYQTVTMKLVSINANTHGWKSFGSQSQMHASKEAAIEFIKANL